MAEKANQRIVRVELLGRDRAELQLNLDAQGRVSSARIIADGCSTFRSAAKDLEERITRFKELPKSWPGVDHASILLRELILRAHHSFQLPYRDQELCHCRAVPTEVVDRAIAAGSHTVASVARMTSAGTSCGTCKPDTESIIRYRLDPSVDASDDSLTDSSFGSKA